MKLKYYLRGLGIGIAVTAAVLMLAGGKKTSLTDEEIIARAKELGMVESVTLSQLSSEKEEIAEAISDDISEENSEELSEEESQDASIAETDSEAESDAEVLPENESVEDVSEVISEETDIEEASETNTTEGVSEPVSEEEISETPGSTSGEYIDEYVIIEVGSGDGSDAVSAKLEQAGLVEDAQMYDDFLCGNGYDRILRTGVHEIPRTADWDTIAEILAGRM